MSQISLSVWLVLGILLSFYFCFIRPDEKQRKKRKIEEIRQAMENAIEMTLVGACHELHGVGISFSRVGNFFAPAEFWLVGDFKLIAKSLNTCITYQATQDGKFSYAELINSVASAILNSGLKKAFAMAIVCEMATLNSSVAVNLSNELDKLSHSAQ